MKRILRKWLYPALIMVLDLGLLVGGLAGCGSTMKPYPSTGIYYDEKRPGYILMGIDHYMRIQQDRAWHQGALRSSPYGGQ